jgi:uncharacterized protein
LQANDGHGMNQDPVRCTLISWAEVQRLSFELATQISGSSFRPNAIIAVARGGFVPARLLCDYLRIYDLASLRVEHYLEGAHKTPAARLKHPVTADISGQQVLIVDDVCDSGDTYRIALEHVQGFSPAAVRSAALHHKAGARFAPDFVGRHIREWRWLIYPWAVTEDVSAFIDQITAARETTGNLRERLYTEHGIRLSERNLSRILRLCGLRKR